MKRKADSFPKTLIAQFGAEVLAADGAERKVPTFALTAYDGKVLRGSSWFGPLVIDYEGMKIAAQKMPTRRNHDPNRVVGHTESCEVKGGKIAAAGVLSFETPDRDEIVNSAKNGFPWQASCTWDIFEVEYIPSGTTTEVNGNKVSGPIDIARKSSVKEISFVDLGASGGTKVSVAASANEEEGRAMKRKVRLKDGTVAELEAGAELPEGAVLVTAADAEPAEPAERVDEVQAMRNRLGDEADRIAAVEKLAKDHPDLRAQAIREGWSPDKTELACMRAARPAPAAASGSSAFDPLVVEAALCQAGNLHNIEKRFDAKTLEASHKAFKGRLGLQDVILMAALANGYSGQPSFKTRRNEIFAAAFSTHSLSTVLANTANKQLWDGFFSVEQTFRRMSSKRTVSDFKQVTGVRLTASVEFEELGNAAEIKHGTLGEETYTNQAKSYAKMLAITRQDIINDDLGVLSDVPKHLGRGAGLKLNKLFWTVVLANASSFFGSGHANLATGAGSALQFSSLQTALQKFRDQTDASGAPVGVQPKLLVVPTALEVSAKVLMNSTEMRNTTASTKEGIANPFMSSFEVLVSAYLSNALLTGNSSTAWYLLADPMDLAIAEVCYLDGVEVPTVETAEADFNTLGVQMRGYQDFGVVLKDYRAGVKSNGA